MTPLRRRFLDDLRLRNDAPRTIEAYLSAVVRFARHFGRSRDVLGPEDVRVDPLHLLERGLSYSTFNQSVCSLRFFYGVTLGRPDLVRMIPFGKRRRKLPCVLSPAEIAQLIEAARPGCPRLQLQVAYACGLRIEESLHLQVADIDSRRMAIVVRRGKGRRVDGGARFRVGRSRS